MATHQQQKDINQHINRLLEPHIPTDESKDELHAFLALCRYGLSEKEKHPDKPEPTTDFIHATLHARINANIPRSEHTARDFAAAQVTRGHIDALRLKPSSSITKESVAVALGGGDMYRSYMDCEVEDEVKRMRDRAMWMKAALQHRVWVLNTEVAKERKDVREMGDLLIKLMTSEGTWQSDCVDLFQMELGNREMVTRWVKAGVF